MHVGEEPRPSDETMGLRLTDSRVREQETLDGLHRQKVDAVDGKTTIMAVSASTKSFMVDNKSKFDEQRRFDDVDETSSGYSSRESHYGENQERSTSRPKPQKSTKNQLVIKEDCMSTQTNNEQYESTVSIGNQSPISKENCKKTLEDSCSCPRQETDLVHANSDVLKLGQSSDKQISIALQTDENLDYCNKTCSTCSCPEALKHLKTDKNFFQPPRLSQQDDTLDPRLPDIRSESKHLSNSDSGQLKAKSKSITRESKEKSTQTKLWKPEPDQELKNLIEINAELEQKLHATNERFDGITKNFECQLLSAVTEIARLRAQLAAVSNDASKLPKACHRCGYYFNREKADEIPQRLLHNASNSLNDVRKAKSFENLNVCSPLAVSGSPNTSLLRSLLKGQDPKQMKMALLERNKSLKDEIHNLKASKPPSRAASTSSLLSATSTQGQSSYDRYDLAMDRKIASNPELTKPNQRPVNEDTRWTKTQRVSRRPHKNSLINPRSTSAAFRTINVTKWGPTS